MLNRDGIRKTTLGAPRQILANVEFQYSVGCVVPKSLGTAVGDKTIAKAGTPVNIDFTNTLAAVKAVAAASGSGSTAVPATPMNAVLLHDVDVTAGNANGTALVFGFVNLNRVDSTVATAIATAQAVSGASPLLTFVKL